VGWGRAQPNQATNSNEASSSNHYHDNGSTKCSNSNHYMTMAATAILTMTMAAKVDMNKQMLN
jgi:hypothetical protein